MAAQHGLHRLSAAADSTRFGSPQDRDRDAIEPREAVGAIVPIVQGFVDARQRHAACLWRRRSRDIRRGDPQARDRRAGHLEGHRPNLLEMVANDGLSMCWLMSVGALLGYASIEVAASGMPMAFWNFGSPGTSDTERIRQETGGAVYSFDSIPDLVGFSHARLTDHAALVELGVNLRRYVLTNHDI